MRRKYLLLLVVALILVLAGCQIITQPVPYPPSDLEALSVSSQSLGLTWQDNALTEDGFYVYRRSMGGYNRIAILEADTTSYSDGDLDPGTTYWYKVTAYNAGGESNLCKEKSATTEEEVRAFFDLSTPENAVRSFLEATLLGDSEKAEECLSDTIPGSVKIVMVTLARMGIEEAMEEGPFLKKLLQSPEFVKELFALFDYKKERIDKDTFYVWWTMADGSSGEEDAFEVVREDGEWRILFSIDTEELLGDLLEEEEPPSGDWESDFYEGKVGSFATTGRYLPKFFIDQDFRDYFFSGESRKAESLLETQQSKSPNDPAILDWLGNFRFQAGDIDSALEYYEKAIKVDPRYAHTYFDRGSLYLNLEEYDLALVDLAKAVEIDPEYPDFQLALGAALLNMGSAQESLIYLATAVLLDPDSTTAKLYLAVAYDQLGYPKKADELLLWILENHPESYEAQVLREQMGY